MPRKPVIDMSAWPSLTLEGNLIAPAMVSRIDQRATSEQTEESYGIRKGLTLRDEISMAFRVGQSHFDTFAKAQAPGADATRRYVRDFLKETFGYDDLTPETGAVAFLAGGRVPIVVVPPTEALDKRSPTLSTERNRSPAFALQDWLNERDDALWGFVTNGTRLRLMRDNASLTRPAFIEADLAQIFINEDAASFAALWLLIHRTRFGRTSAPAADCALERWREAGSKEGEAARDRLAGQVEEALRILGTGFLEANPELARRLQSGTLPLTDWFNELLRLVYRLIFLMVAEDRNLLHPEKADKDARRLYTDGYSLSVLRAQSIRRAAWDRHHDRFEGLKIVFRALAHGEPALGLPALGGLFGRHQLPTLEAASLRNRALMEALYRLSWLTDGTGLVPVNWRAMKTEELGSVYESLLELQPQLAEDGRALAFATDTAEQRGNQRKTTGSYYTPDSLVQALLDTALDPVLDRAEAESDDKASALLALTVIDPACGSGHFLLAAAQRIATRVARIRADGTPSLTDFRHALRDVARCCLHGVDKNPMAVELTKVALWIETVDPGLPLGFFDAQIRCGDALLGVFDLKALEDGIPDAAYKPLSSDDKEAAKHYATKNKREKAEKGLISSGFGFNRARDLMRDYESLRAMPEETVEQVETKTARLKSLTAQGAGAWALHRACDLYVAAFLLPKCKGGPHAGPDGMPRRGAETVPTSGALWEYLRGVTPFGPMFAAATDAALTARAFHWPIEFPDIMAKGGFDVVLGNPPWDTMSPDYKEFFSVHDPNIRHMSPDEQEQAYTRLLSDPVIAARWEQHCEDLYASVRFIKSSGRYRLFAEGNLGKGDFNVYRMFVETALALTKPGRVAAQFVPEGLYNGANATAIRRELFTAFQLEHLAGFENTKGIWFDKIDTRMKFCLYVAWNGGETNEFHAAFRINTSQKLQEFMAGGGLRIPVSVVKEFSPDAVAIMEFAAQSEIDICTRMYALYPKFGTQIEDLPYRHYMREVDMGTDRSLFSEGSEGLPVFEGRMIDAYDYRAKGYVSGRGRSAVWKDFPFGSTDKRIQPQWRITEDRIPEKLGDRIYRYRIGFADVASPTNQRSLVAALLPIGIVSGHSVPTIELRDGSAVDLLLWIGVANSLAMDFLVRPKVSLHMSYTALDTLPFPRDFKATPAADAIARRVCSLCAVGDEMEAFRAQALEAGILAAADDVIEAPDQRAIVAAEIDALVARDVFRLTKQEMLYILDPDNILGPGCGVETFKALRNAELREFNEFRTQNLILDAWDRVEQHGTFAALGMADATSAAKQQTIQLPPLENLPDAAWARAVPSPQHDPLAALSAILKSLDGPTPIRTVRLTAAIMLEPHLLTPLLPPEDQAQWRRLVGQEAEPRSGNVIGFAARTTPGWNAAITNHRGNGRLLEDIAARTWSPGTGLERFDTAGWPEGRARFVINALQKLDIDATIEAAPGEILGWIKNVANR